MPSSAVELDEFRQLLEVSDVLLLAFRLVGAAVHKRKKAHGVFGGGWDLRHQHVAELAVEAILAVAEEVVDARIVHPSDVLLTTVVFVLAPRKRKVLLAAQACQEVHLLVKVALLAVHPLSTIFNYITRAVACTSRRSHAARSILLALSCCFFSSRNRWKRSC
jgi:hypothetical protein